jgi:phage tail-like protein
MLRLSEAFLAVELDGDVIRTIPLTFQVLTIGRAPDNSLSLQHPHVGRHHLELRLTAQGLMVTDLGSVNGTFVDETRLLPHQPTRLDPSQSLRVGPFILAARRAPIDMEEAELEPVATEPVPHGVQRNGHATPATVDVERALARRAAARRPSVAPTRPAEPVSRYLEYLPAIFADNDFLGRFLLIFESVWEPLENRQDHMHMYVDPATCPASFLPWLASWFDMETGSHWPEDRVRDMIGQAMDLYQWRGTAYGMARIVELWTGIHPRIEESPDEPFVFNVRMRSEADRPIDRRLVEDLLRTHKPAHAGFVLEIES